MLSVERTYFFIFFIFGSGKFLGISGNFDFRFREILGISGNFDFRFREILGISGNFDFGFREILGISGNFDFGFRKFWEFLEISILDFGNFDRTENSVEIEIGKRNLKRNIRQSSQYNNNERRIQAIEKFVHGSRNGVTII